MNRRMLSTSAMTAMTFLPCVVLLYFPLFCASLPTFNGTSVPTLDASDVPLCSDGRTLWNIIWSCAATVVACTWTAVHPNIPGIKEKRFPVACRRLFTMVMALIAPELIITWAMRQFLSARKATREFNEFLKLSESAEGKSASAPTVTEWTVTHGFFAWMGGFMLYVNNKPRVTLTPGELLEFVRAGSVDMPIITEEEIDDRSKGDGLSKAIAILQLAWFVLQLIARYVQNLPVTLLEVDTLAITALTCIAYCLWWMKPKVVGCSHPVHWKATAAAASPPSELTYDKVDVGFSEGGRLIYLVYPLLSLMGIATANSPGAVRSRRVPSLGGYGKDERSDLITVLVGCLSGMLFGAIHCLGWYFLFHTRLEQILWRGASLFIVCTPACITLFFGFLFVYDIMHEFIARIIASSLFCGGVITCVAYIPARITLITLMFQSLRSLPADDGIFDTVVWTKFIPLW
ncbi:hypothetical protein DFH29DRAFT_496717 [Suillus ampliporus]|nr:hypothetical protein DFH29DRAFT_496717 [Suillus ampliporus]